MSGKIWIVIAGVTGALGVAIGAFGAHGLPGWLEKSGVSPEDVVRRMETFEIGVRYHLVHALALLGVGLWSRTCGGAESDVGGGGFSDGDPLLLGASLRDRGHGHQVLGDDCPRRGCTVHPRLARSGIFRADQ